MARPPRTSVAVRAVLVVGLVTAVAGTVRFWNLGHPEEKIFDEVYYASDGCLWAGLDHRACGLDAPNERSWVHPPLGKHLISWGIHGFGNDPFGWRVSAAVAGTATVALVGALGFLLTGSAVWAGVAAVLLAAEHLHFVQSRIAMLDVFQAFFAVLGILLVVAERRRRDRREAILLHPVGRTAGATPRASDERRAVGGDGVPWRWIGAGAAFGAGAAVKWAGVLALAAGALLALAWERNRHSRRGAERPIVDLIVRNGAAFVLAFVLVPVVVYTLTWIPWLADHAFSFSSWWSNHVAMADYHRTLEAFDDGEPIHPYMSKAWTWLLLLRPVAYSYEGGDGTAAEILGIGSPFLFWGALLVIPYLGWILWRHRDWRAGAILLPVLFQYVPWLLVTRPLFLFYMTPVTPFLALGTAYALRDVSGLRPIGPRAAAAIPAVAVVVAVGLFAFFWPVLVGSTIDRAAWDSRIWFDGWV